MSTLSKPINSIVAYELYGVIGHGTKMPGWDVIDDFKINFVPKTKGCPLIMGSITAMTLGRPLKGRVCMVLTKDKNKATSKELAEKGFIVTDDPWEAIRIAQNSPGETIWVIGGGQIYQWARENVIVKEIHVTKIMGTYRSNDQDEIKFCGFPTDQYFIDPSRTLYFKKRPCCADGQSTDKGNSDDAVVEVYIREY